MNRPWKYGTVLARSEADMKHKFVGAMLEEQRKRRFMVVSDTGGDESDAVRAISVSSATYDPNYILHPSTKDLIWVPIDEPEA